LIETLRIADLAIVDEVELEFGAGLNVLTGETGAGKSIVLGALSLLAGARASADAVRDGSERAEVEAVFSTEGLPELEAELRALELGDEGAPAGGGHELIVQRSVARGGRSRARVAGELLPVGSLAKLFEGRIEISSQHSSQALLKPEQHARLLDVAGGHLGLRTAVEQGCGRLRALDEELLALRTAAEERVRREDFLRFQVEEIDEVGLAPDELPELESEHRRLANAEQLREEGAGVVAALSGEEHREASGALDLVARALRGVEALAAVDGDLEPQAERLRGLEEELRDLSADLERYVDRLEVDPSRLAQLEERLGQIHGLRRKYGEDAAAILAFRDQAQRELASLEGADERIEALECEREDCRAKLQRAASKLSKARARAAKELAARVEGPLRDLALPDARFAVGLSKLEPPEGLPCGPSGAEAVEFLFAANAGAEPRPLQRVASGGELSRVFLALKNALRGAGRGMVLIFDEVDAGIGGRVAERVGRCLAELARDHQVLCITHHPQIAALADTHFRVSKRRAGKQTLAAVERVEGDARVDEIARMAGGETISQATRKHAAALLRAQPVRN
jgi:DNA repair protein RecN (Recombination protein N)